VTPRLRLRLCSRRRWLLGVLTAAVAAAAPAAAQPSPTPLAAPSEGPPPELRGVFDRPTLQGQGQLRFLGLRVYEARLWTPAGQPVGSGGWVQPLALEIRYQRALQGQQIAQRSVQEMQRQGDVDDTTVQRWLQALQNVFPDVVAGDRITGVQLPREGVQFFVNGRPKGVVNDAEMARRFFGIWLSPQSSDPKLRAALLASDTAKATP
jgi:Chalcone isomerase-like